MQSFFYNIVNIMYSCLQLHPFLACVVALAGNRIMIRFVRTSVVVPFRGD